MRDWSMAKAWLHKALNPDSACFASKSEANDSPDPKSTRK